jgi:serine/threonine protein kinase
MPGLEGRVLNQYELRRLVGRGGMADVYEGYDEQYGRIVAVKVFKRDDEEMLHRFIREARFMSALHNDHLVPIYDSGQCLLDGYPRFYIVMPFLIGGTLRARIRRSPLLLVETCHNLRGIADALDYIHQEGIIHRDIKSSNVLLDAEGNCYLSDFGIARTVSDASQLTSTGSVLGTVDYVAPELFVTGQKADVLSDLYALGVLLFEMVTGRLPFTAENQIAVVAMHMHSQPPLPSSIVPSIPSPIDQVIMKALDKQPARRYGSAGELADAFCHAVTLRDTGIIQDQNYSMTTFSEHSPDSAMPAAGAKQIILPPVPPPAARIAQTPVPASASQSVMDVNAAIAPHPMSAGEPPRATRRSAVTPVPPTSSRPSRSSRFRFWVVAILALVTLLLITGVVSYALLTPQHSSTPGIGGNPTQPNTNVPAGQTVTTAPSPTATPNLTATALANAQATATAKAQATETARAHATATAVANAQATAGVIQTATAGQPAYQDALNNPNNPATQTAKWDGLDGSSNQCVFSPDGYHVKGGVNLVNFYGCHETGYTYQNATVSVDVSMLSGHSGGLFFRLNTDSFGFYDGYLFEVDSKGNYKISAVSGDNTVTPIQDWRATTALKQGLGVPNTLQVIFSGTTYLFYANGVYLTTITDTTYTSVGDIGFLATSTDTNANVLYNNLKIFPHA